MNNYIPSEVKDLTASKQRVMQNVIKEIENNQRNPKHKWLYVVITAITAISAILFVFNEIFIENEQITATEQHLDITKPTISDERDLLYLHGVTLGDSQSNVLDVFGENYTIGQEDGSGADFVMDYDGTAKFYFYEDKLASIVFLNVDENYFDQLFNEYDGFKFTSTPYIYDDRFLYSKETNQVLKASIGDIDGNLQLSLYYPDPDLKENADFLYMTEQNLHNEQQSQSQRYIDLTKPTFYEEQGSLYLHGFTLGDSPSKLIEQLGGNYIIGQADGSGADFILDYDGIASFHFYQDKLDTIISMNVDENYFDKLFYDYDGFKFLTPTAGNNRYFYSKETGQLLKATIVPNGNNGNLYLYLMRAGKDLLENPDFPKIEQVLD